MAGKSYSKRNNNSKNNLNNLTFICNGPTFVVNGNFPTGALNGVNFGAPRPIVSKNKSGAQKKAIKGLKMSKHKAIKVGDHGIQLFPAVIGDSAASWNHVKKAEYPDVMALGISGGFSATIFAKMPQLMAKMVAFKRKQLLIFIGVNDALNRKTEKEHCDAVVCGKNWCKIIDYAINFSDGMTISVSLPYKRSSLNTKYQKTVSKAVQDHCVEHNINCVKWDTDPEANDIHHPTNNAYIAHFGKIFANFEQDLTTEMMDTDLL